MTAAPGRPSTEPLEGLKPDDLKRALEFIKKNYVAPATLDDTALNRATLTGLLTRLGPGITLVSKTPGQEPTPTPLYQEIIGEHIGYLRPGAMRKGDLGEMDNALRMFAAKKVDALILDLRAAIPASDFAIAAEFAQRFVPKGEQLFTLHGNRAAEDRVFTSDRSPAYTGIVAVLIDEETLGSAEILASVLHARDKAILIGQPSAGGAAVYSELPLGDELVLRVAAAEVVLPGETGKFPRSVQPDLTVELAAAAKHQIFSRSLTKGMAGFVFEEDQPHLNEAALLAGTNPEIEAMQERQQRRARGESPPLHDAVAQRAMDVITSIGVYARQPSRLP